MLCNRHAHLGVIWKETRRHRLCGERIALDGCVASGTILTVGTRAPRRHTRESGYPER